MNAEPDIGAGAGPRLWGRRIIVTGAASGMGAAIATLFAREGARLALLDIDETALAAVSGRTGATPLTTDIACERQVRAATVTASRAMGGIDGIVNAAGILRNAPFAATSVDDWRRIHDINLLGPVLLCQAALADLQASAGATIVNIASLGGLKPFPMSTAYAASKAGLISLTANLAQELAPQIRVNAICPGLIRTPMTDAIAYEGRKGTFSRNALLRKGTAMEVAYLALFLTSGESSFITGQSIVIDGGVPNPLATAAMDADGGVAPAMS